MRKENCYCRCMTNWFFETPEDVVEEEAKWIREEMTSAMILKAPLKVEIGWGKNWQEGK